MENACEGVRCRGRQRIQGKREEAGKGGGCRPDRLQPLLWESTPEASEDSAVSTDP